jgi:hypothetical protein
LGSGCARVLGAVAVLTSAPHARADDLGTPIEPSDEKVRLVYEAPSGCPDRAALLEGVRARIGSEWEAPEGELSRQIDVRVASRGGRYVATIEFFDVDGQRVTRSVGGEQCQNVVNGIALVTALAIESRVEEALDQSEPVAPPAAAPPTPAPTPRPVPRPAPPPPVNPAPGPWGAWRAGARGSGVTGVGPELSLGAGFFAGLEWGALRFGLAVDMVRSSRIERKGIPANFTLATGRLEGGAGFWPAHALGLEAAAFIEAGSLSAEADLAPRVTIPEEGSAPFVAPGVVARAVTVWAPLLVELEVMARFPLVRERFGVGTDDPDSRVYQVREFAAGAALGAGVRF